jgi:predicted MFS family arabinose efflux permease
MRKQTSNLYVLSILTATYILHSVDRYIVGITLESIKHEFVVSDRALGILSGLGYALFYVAFSIPVAMWADRSNRRNIVALALGLFSAMTMFCGMASSYVQLLISRFAVGVGESGTLPASHSIIADLFPRDRRATAMGILGSGANIGILLSFLVGGWVNQLYGWRMVFMVVGAPGLLLTTILLFTVREPSRGVLDGVNARTAKAPKLGEVFAFLKQQRSYWHLLLGCALVASCMLGTLNWFATFAIRSYGIKSGEIGTLLALQLGIGGTLGTFTIGMLADRLGRRDVRWNMWVLILLYALILPFWIVSYLSHDKMITIALFTLPALAPAALTAPSFALIQTLSPLRMRSVAAAIQIIGVSAVAGGLGPLIIGSLSDLYAEKLGVNSLRYALLTMLLTIPWGMWHLWRAGAGLADDIARADRYNNSPESYSTSPAVGAAVVP